MASTPTTSARPLRADAERNRRRVLAAAEELFAERGLGASLDEVAQRAGVGVGTVYRRFPDKGALIDALFEDRMETVLTFVEEGTRHPDPWEGFVGVVCRLLEMQASDRAMKELLLGETRRTDRIEACRGRIEPTMAAVVRRAQEAGVLRPDLEATDVPMLVLACSTAAVAGRAVEGAVWERVLAVVLDGLREPAQARGALPGPALAPEDVEVAMRAAHARPGRG